MASEAGFRYPAAITVDLHTRLTPNQWEVELGQSYEGRLWDVVFLASFAARNAVKADQSQFEASQFEVEQYPPHITHRNTLKLWIAVGPGDEGEPVITIGFPQDF